MCVCEKKWRAKHLYKGLKKSRGKLIFRQLFLHNFINKNEKPRQRWLWGICKFLEVAADALK